MGIDVRGLTPLLQVFDMPTSLRFYCDILGFKVVQTDGKPLPHNDWVWLRLNDADLMLNTAYEHDKRPQQPDALRATAHRDTALYFGAPDVQAVYESLHSRSRNVKLPSITPYGMKQLYLDDPDGYQLCFQWKVDSR